MRGQTQRRQRQNRSRGTDGIGSKYNSRSIDSCYFFVKKIKKNNGSLYAVSRMITVKNDEDREEKEKRKRNCGKNRRAVENGRGNDEIVGEKLACSSR